jgi:hypothetical protein
VGGSSSANGTVLCSSPLAQPRILSSNAATAGVTLSFGCVLSLTHLALVLLALLAAH